MPDPNRPAMDGRDLRASYQEGGYDHVYTETNGFIGATDGRWKYVHFSRGGETLCELYDLTPHRWPNCAVFEHLAIEGLQARGLFSTYHEPRLIPKHKNDTRAR
jgi:hypothetical protein